jgi:DNA polymerase III delta prime subunit
MDIPTNSQRAKRTLAAWFAGGRLPHTVMIEGRAGTGRTALAKMIARAILCEANGGKPCGTCRHCVKMEKEIHPDFEILEGGGGARSFHVDKVREMRSDAHIRPNEADARVFLLLGAQTMTTQAQNALLKIIEEPPRGVHFILICENREQMLTTIQSRAAVITMDEIGGGEPDDNAAKAAKAAGAALHALTQGDELAALAYLHEVERDREAFIQRLGQLREAAAHLREMHIVDIIDDVCIAAEGNGSIAILTVSLCGRIRDGM